MLFIKVTVHKHSVSGMLLFVFLIYQVDCVPRGKVIVNWRLKRWGICKKFFNSSLYLPMSSPEGKVKSGIKVQHSHKCTGHYTVQIP